MNRRLISIIIGLATVMAALAAGTAPGWAQQVPGGTPDYFNTPNWAYTPPIRKFVDALPGLSAAGKNNLNQYIPIAIPDTTTYAGSDYYEIELNDYSEKMHSDMPPTKLRGYRQTNTTDLTVRQFHYLGPLIIATKGRPVRVKFTNKLGTGAAGKLFIPVDTSIMGAGAYEINYDPVTKATFTPAITGMFTENRATLHLHGGRTPWISDGTPHQWITPAGENPDYPQGVSVTHVPDMWFNAAGNTITSCAGALTCGVAGATNNPGAGSQTFYWSNEQSARLMFYHDHAWGITRLNVYVGEAAGYLVTDPTDDALVAAGLVPAEQIPLIIQDKTFVDAATIDATDPTWNWGSNPPARNTGDLWWPHVYMPAQNPYNPNLSGINDFGRWHYGPWFWPPTTGILYPPVPNPLYDPTCDPNVAVFCQPPEMPGTPNPSWGAEAFMDTPIVNGTAYPTLTVEPKAYRFRILNAAHDRFFNLQLYEADGTVAVPADCPTCVANTEVKMVPAVATPGFPATWPTDQRIGGVPDPATSGPSMIQIATEGGFLPQPVVLPNQPVNWNTDVTTFNAGNVLNWVDGGGTLMLGPAERADVVIDFSQFAGKTLILYNDAPAPWPALDPHYDYYTGAPDLTGMGGSAGTPVGRGPNTRTIMQIKVAAGPVAPAFNLTALQAAFISPTGVFATGQEPVLIGQTAYNQNYNITFPITWPYWGAAKITDTSMSFVKPDGIMVSNYPIKPKAIQDEMGETFDDYGRMSAKLGLELAFTNAGIQTFVLQNYVDPATEIFNDGEFQIWKITHNGVDTHPVHFHLFEVQVINRVGWDGFIRMPDPNELGWKDTIRVSPLEDTIVAIRPAVPNFPFPIPDSNRPLNPATPLGSTMGFTNLNPLTAQPMNPPVTNIMTNFGWEYVWHCHILSHEENDMMRPIVVSVPTAPPAAPTALTTTAGSGGAANKVDLTWTDTATNEIGFRVERDSGAGGFATLVQLSASETGTVTYTDTAVSPGRTYTYRVFAFNTKGDSLSSNNASATVSAYSPASAVTIAPNLPSPHNAGTAVLFTANASGSTAVYQYRFWLKSGATTTLMQNYSAANAWSMPASTGPGTYTITVDVRTDTTSPVPDVSNSVANYVIQLPPALGVTITPSQPSPHGAGTPVVFTARAFGSTGYEYQFSLYSSGAGTAVVQPWTAASTWTLPGSTVAGDYTVMTEARTFATQTPVTATVNYSIINHTLSGAVRTSLGAPLSGIGMTLSTGATATTDAAGSYLFGNLASGSTYTVTPNVPNYTIAPIGVPIAGSSPVNVDFTVPVYSISGTVQTQGGRPLGGITVNLSGPANLTAMTDVLGAFTFSGLLNSGGTCTVAPVVPNYAAFGGQGVLVANANQTGIIFSIPTYTITGMVRTLVTMGVTGVSLELNSTPTMTTLSSSGSFTFTDVLNGNYVVTPGMTGQTFTGNGMVTVADASPLPLDFILNTNAIGGTIRTSGGAPVAGVVVSLSSGTTTTTDATGMYSFTNCVNGPYTVTPIMSGQTFTGSGDVTMSGAQVTADFTLSTYSLGGTVLTSGGAPVSGVQVTLSTGATCTTGSSGIYNCTDVLNGNYTVTPVMIGQTFTPGSSLKTVNGAVLAGVDFILDPHMITASAGAGGSISSSGTTTVNHGDGIGFTITPDVGYHIADVLADGVSAGAVTSHGFANVTQNHTIAASFAANVYAVTVSSTEGGVISPAAAQAVHGTTASFALTIDPGYHLASISGCGGTLNGNTFTTGAVVADCAVTIAFELPSGDMDSDGNVAVTDALRALRIAADIIPPTVSDMTFGDVAPIVNGRSQPNNVIDIGDAVVILRRSLGLANF